VAPIQRGTGIVDPKLPLGGKGKPFRRKAQTKGSVVPRLPCDPAGSLKKSYKITGLTNEFYGKGTKRRICECLTSGGEEHERGRTSAPGRKKGAADPIDVPSRGDTAEKDRREGEEGPGRERERLDRLQS